MVRWRRRDENFRGTKSWMMKINRVFMSLQVGKGDRREVKRAQKLVLKKLSAETMT